ncbi:hypothetical protein CYLTODRAFT_446867 [Cylindrobasidium torrendii FP15055 ss-10]|uniref:Uncharacterized protein n=1 Tax=Cylindrobasidium torrendii FP15055 ss-10 TaxID=1314674 RepID=A0A0D7AYQ9_9AGAR|nr:hypothetical protein CYLTODRAFT_446867 [Cylindrobasidium torrendii FP15055 ss-10]
MSKRRVGGVSAATTEAARRQLMQPVPCWEKAWVTPEGFPGNTTFKVYKWVKTDRVPQFKDDEVELDEPLAPLPDAEEVEVIDDEEKDEEKEDANGPIPGIQPSAEQASGLVPEPTEEGKVEEEVDEPTQLTLEPPETDLSLDGVGDPLAMAASLDSSGGNMMVDDALDDSLKINDDGGISLDMDGFGPDGLNLTSHDLTQMQDDDALMGGPMMDQTEDPFSGEGLDAGVLGEGGLGGEEMGADPVAPAGPPELGSASLDLGTEQ